MNDFTPSKWIKRVCEYWKDKQLADKCGLQIKDICVHELKPIVYPRPDTIKMWQCIKCGEFYR